MSPRLMRFYSRVGAETAEEADVVAEVGTALEAGEDVRALQNVAGVHMANELTIFDMQPCQRGISPVAGLTDFYSGTSVSY
jgi:hypothetical protein